MRRPPPEDWPGAGRGARRPRGRSLDLADGETVEGRWGKVLGPGSLDVARGDPRDPFLVAIGVVEPQSLVLDRDEEVGHLTGRVESERKAPDQVLLGESELALGDRPAGHPGELLADPDHHLGRLGRASLRSHGERCPAPRGREPAVDAVLW